MRLPEGIMKEIIYKIYFCCKTGWFIPYLLKHTFGGIVIIKRANQISYENQYASAYIGDFPRFFLTHFKLRDKFGSYSSLRKTISSMPVSQFEEKPAILFSRDGKEMKHFEARLMRISEKRSILLFKKTEEDQKELDELMSLYRTFEKYSFAIAITDLQGQVLFVNPSFEKLTGYTQDELMGSIPYVLQKSLHPEAFNDNLWSTIEKGDTWRGELLNRRKDGKEYRVRITITSVHDQKRKVANYLLFKEDITHEVQKKELLERASRMWYNIWNGVIMVSYDTPMASENFKILRANPVAERLLKFSLDQYIGQPVASLFSSIPKEFLLGQMRKVVFSKGATTHIEYETHKQGLVMVFQFRIVYWGKHQLAFLLQDITGQKRVEASLALHEEILGNVTSLLPLYVFQVDKEGVIRFSEKGKGLAFQGKEGDSIFEVYQEDHKALHQISSALQGQKVHYSGTLKGRHFDSVLTPYWNNGQIDGIVGTVVDITEKRGIENQLSKAEAFIENIQQVAQIGVWSCNIITGYCEWSEGMYMLHDIANHMTIRRDQYLKYVHPEDVSSFVRAFKEALVSGKMVVEHRIFVQGEVRWLKHEAVMKEVQGGGQQSKEVLVGVTYDITKIKNAEIFIEQQEVFMHNILTNLPIGMAVFDEEGTLMQSNSLIHTLLLLSNPEETSINCFEHELFVSSGLSLLLKKALSGEQIINYVTEFNFINPTSLSPLSGEVKWYNVTTFSLEVKEGHRILALMMDDISDKKLLETALLESEEKFSSLFNESRDVMLLLKEENLEVLDVNQSFLRVAAYESSDTIIGTDLFLLKLPLSSFAFRKVIGLYLRQGGLYNVEISLSHKMPQQPKYLSLTVQRIFIGGGFGVLVVGRDITQQREVENENRENQDKILMLQEVADEHKLMAMRSAMNPHFIFNCLNSIQYYINRNEKESASRYLALFSKLARSVLNSSINQYVTLDDEINLIKHYIQLEQVRFEHRFKYTIFIEEDIDRYTLEIPPLILQPYIENAIIHGLQNKSEGGELSVIIHREGEFLECVVEDNGIGREKAKQYQKHTHKSVGMSITQERLKLINKFTRASVKIIDMEDEEGRALGTKVKILIEV